MKENEHDHPAESDPVEEVPAKKPAASHPDGWTPPPGNPQTFAATELMIFDTEWIDLPPGTKAKPRPSGRERKPPTDDTNAG